MSCSGRVDAIGAHDERLRERAGDVGREADHAHELALGVVARVQDDRVALGLDAPEVRLVVLGIVDVAEAEDAEWLVHGGRLSDARMSALYGSAFSREWSQRGRHLLQIVSAL
jgi:hypothetical protein